MSRVKINMKFPDFSEMIKKYRNEIHLSVAATLQTNRAMLFDKEGQYNGHHKWAPLKLRKGRILQDRGTLRKSMGPTNAGDKPGRGPGSILKIEGDVVTIGTSLNYARTMNDGGTIKAKNAQALMIPVPKGANAQDDAKKIKTRKIDYKMASGRVRKLNVIFRKSVTIPPRDFESLTSQDLQEVKDTVKRKVWEVIDRGR